MKKLNTEILFQLLIKWMKPQIICDVGSRDAIQALNFKRILQSSRIVAFEANPNNAEQMAKNPLVTSCNIELQRKAVSSKNGTITFHIEVVPEGEDHTWRIGTSSTLKRMSDSAGMEEIEVEAVRLDSFLANTTENTNIALWIDVEGAAYDVLLSMEGIKDKVSLIHVEVETREFWVGQKLKDDIEKLMTKYGFVGVARGRGDEQHDVIYLAKHIINNSKIKLNLLINTAFVLTYIRKWLGRKLGWLILIIFIPNLLLKK